MAYCMYLRKSRADVDAEAHGEGETLLRHELILTELAKRKNIKIDHTYREVVSGETIEARPEMQRLLQDVSNGKWTGVLVVEIERLARGDTINQGVVARTFKMSNTLIITPSKTYDPCNEFDEEYFEFGLFMSRREYKTINRRQQRGRRSAAKEGKYIASVAPYGYDKIKIPNDKGYTLKANPEQSPVLKNIFKWYTEGALQEDNTIEKLGATRIANKLNEMGIKSATNSEWVKASISDILKNPTYMGKVRWGYEKEEETIEDGKITTTYIKDPDGCIFVNGLHDGLITEQTYNKAQNIRESRSHPPIPGSKILKNPLTDLIFCGKCGQRMTRLAKSKKTPYDTIKCLNTKCDNISAPLYLVEEVIIDSLNNWLVEFKNKWNVEKLDTPYDDLIQDKIKIIEQLKSNLAKSLEQKERIHTLLEQGVYSVGTFTQRNEKIDTETKDLNDAIKKHNIELKDLKAQAEYNDVFIPNAQNILDNYYDMSSAAMKNEALKETLEKIEYIKNDPNKKGNRDNKNFEIALFPRVIRF